MSKFGKALEQLRRSSREDSLDVQSVANLSISTQLGFLRSSRKRTYVPVDLAPAGPQQVLPDGHIESNPFGSHYVVRTTYPEHYHHGRIRLSRFNVPDVQHLLAIMRNRISISSRERIIFLDTETTGMHGGTGICPFLVGLGYFSGDEFQFIQYFIRDFDDEPSMLYALRKLLSGFDLVITYNGASFDVPLLETRFTLARFDNPFQDIGHFDLLNPARRLWRNGHGSCRLVALERLLSFMRGPDVTGAMIPRLYFEYLQQQPTRAFADVFTHNMYDVVSLAALTIHACDCLTREPATLDDPLDLYSLGRILANTADWRRSAKYYEMALSGGLPEVIRVKALENLSMLYRREGDIKRSFRICQDLMESTSFSIAAYEGAAIYYERVLGDVEAALQVVVIGLKRLDDSPPTRRWRALLRSRWERLQQKVIGFPSSETE